MAHESFDVPILGLPFQRSRHPVQIAQGFHGPYHRHIDPLRLDYAVDFALPFGSIVLAMRSGVVRAMVMHFDSYSPVADLDIQQIQRVMNMQTNWIMVDHGSFQTMIAHLEKGSERVRVGQRVDQGKMLARSGRSGWVGDIPNVHVQAQRLMSISDDMNGNGQIMTLPVCFSGYDGPLEHSEIVCHS